MSTVCTKHCVSALLLSAYSLSALASPTEIPINTSGATGFVPLVYRSYTTNAAISYATEVDGYTFNGAVGEKISLVAVTTNGLLDTSVALRNSVGTVIASTSCIGHSPSGVCALNIQQQLPSTGLYTVNIADSGANDVGPYTLHLDRYPPTNNWLGIPYGPPTQFAIDHLGDSDYFAFNVNAGSQFRLNIATQNANLLPHVEVWDNKGVLIQTGACVGHTPSGTCSVQFDLGATATGYYKVGVYDVGWNNIENYQIGVSCLFGNCANGVPSPVPELPATWLLTMGFGIIGWRRLSRI